MKHRNAATQRSSQGLPWSPALWFSPALLLSVFINLAALRLPAADPALRIASRTGEHVLVSDSFRQALRGLPRGAFYL